MTAILAMHFLKLNPGATILYDVICSRVVAETIEAAGGIAIRTKVGHSNIKIALLERNAVFDGEHSRHYYFRDNFYPDSVLIATTCAIGALGDTGHKFSQLAFKYDIFAELKAAYADGEQDELDGLSVNYADWWLNVRTGNTEPYLRLNIEAKTPELLNNQLAELTDILN